MASIEKEVPNVLYDLKNGEAIRRSVKTSIKNPDDIQVVSGVEAGETIIVPIEVFRPRKK